MPRAFLLVLTLLASMTASAASDDAATSLPGFAMFDLVFVDGSTGGQYVSDDNRVWLNRTGEGNHQGPTVSWRGINNRSYYKLSPDKRQEWLALHPEEQRENAMVPA